MVYVVFIGCEMEPLLTLDGMQRQTTRLPWLACAVVFAITLQFATFVLVLTMLLDVSPVVPDLVKLSSIASNTFNTAQSVLPDVNATVHDVKELLPDIQRIAYYVESICKHTSGCTEYKS